MFGTEPAYHRILLKLSGEAFGGTDGKGIDTKRIAQYCRRIIDIHGLGVEIGVVVGGGNLLRGASVAGSGLQRATADYMGMLATVINGMAMKDIFEELGCPARVMSAIDVNRVCEPYIRLRALRHMEKGRIVVFAGGTGNPFFTTDSTASLRAVELNMDVLLKATKVDGVFDKDPDSNRDAKKYEELSYDEALEKQLAIMDTTAIAMCRENNMPIIVFNMNVEGNIRGAVLGEKVGTRVIA